MIILQAYSDRRINLPLCVRLLLGAVLMAPLSAARAEGEPSSQPATNTLGNQNYESAAREVMQHMQTTFSLPDEGLYTHSTTDRNREFMWGNGIMFSALLGAAR